MATELTLNDYQVANLRAAIEATGYNGVVQDSSPLAVLNSGDWIGEIYWQLPKGYPTGPNHTPNEYAIKARNWGLWL